MVNLILDTNQWLYLANALDPHAANSKPDHHLTLLGKVLQMIADGDIMIWKTEIVQEEWARNRQYAFDFIKKIKTKRTEVIKQLEQLNEQLGKGANKRIHWLKEATKKHYAEQIKLNEEHIAKVDYLVSSAKTYFIREEVHIEVNKWAIAKKAPFKGNKSNSSADATILFGAIDYFNRARTNGTAPPETAFISANVKDFCGAAKNETHIIHEDLAPKFAEIGMQFFVSLPKALQQINDSLMSKEEWEQIDRLFNMRFGVMECMSCSGSDSNSLDAFVNFADPIIINTRDSALVQSYNQEEEDDNEGMQSFGRPVIQIGYCGTCEVAYIKCGCGNVLCAENEVDELLTCDECERKYSLDYDFDSALLDTVWIVHDKEEDND